MALSNEANEANEANVGSLGRSVGGGLSVLPDRVDLPFITEGNVADQRLAPGVWDDRFWSGEWAAWLMLVDFAREAKLPYASPTLRIATLMPSPGNVGNGTCKLIILSTLASAAR